MWIVDSYIWMIWKRKTVDLDHTYGVTNMAWWNPFTWGEKTRDDLLDKNDGLVAQVGGWIGNMEYTDEEKAEANAKIVGHVIDYAQATLSENTERSKARRNIAQMWIKTQLFLIIITAVVGMFDTDKAKILFDLATSTVMIATTSAITIFFFGSYGIVRGMKAMTEKDKK